MRVRALRTGNGFYAGKIYDFKEDGRGHFNTKNTNGHERFILRDSVYNGSPCPHFITKSTIHGFQRAMTSCWEIVKVI